MLEETRILHFDPKAVRRRLSVGSRRRGQSSPHNYTIPPTRPLLLIVTLLVLSKKTTIEPLTL